MSSLVSESRAPGAMTSLMLSQVRRKVGGSFASTFQKLLIQSVPRVLMMSSYTARTSTPASSYPISRTIATSASAAGIAQCPSEPPRQEHPEHTKIADQRPDRMPERLRPIMLEFDVTEPREAVAGDGRGGQPAPIALDCGGSDCGHGE